MAAKQKTDWEKVLDITVSIAYEENGRGKKFDEILAKTLNIDAEYNVSVFIIFDIDIVFSS